MRLILDVDSIEMDYIYISMEAERKNLHCSDPSEFPFFYPYSFDLIGGL